MLYLEEKEKKRRKEKCLLRSSNATSLTLGEELITEPLHWRKNRGRNCSRRGKAGLFCQRPVIPPRTFLRRLCASWPPLILPPRHIVLINRNNYSTLLYGAYVLGNRDRLRTRLTPNVAPQPGALFAAMSDTPKDYAADTFHLIVNRHRSYPRRVKPRRTVGIIPCIKRLRSGIALMWPSPFVSSRDSFANLKSTDCKHQMSHASFSRRFYIVTFLAIF